MRASLVVGLASVAVLFDAVVSGQQRSFKSGTDLVTVDVHVVNAAGDPVPTLRPEDFEVRVDGRARRLTTVQFVDYNASVPSAHPAGVEAASTRTLLVLVDEANIRAGAARFVASAASAFIERLPIGDRVGVLTIPFSSSRIEPTTDRNAVKQILQRISGHLNAEANPVAEERSVGLSEAFALGNDERAWSAVIARECLEKRGGQDPNRPGEASRECVAELQQAARARASDVRQRMIESVRNIAKALEAASQTPGPKTVILLSQELPVPDTPALRSEFNSESAAVERAAARAQANIYVLQLDTPLFDVASRVHPATAQADADVRSFGLETVATRTGGHRMLVSGKPEAAFERTARETSGLYLVGFEADPSDRDGKPHAVTVTTSRKDVKVRARRVFAFRESAPPVTSPSVARPSTTSDPVQPSPRIPTATEPAAAPQPQADRADPPTSPVPGDSTSESLGQILERMGHYVQAYGERAALLVATEKYTQRVNTEDGTTYPPRRLTAEFAIVKAAGAVGWIGFRDVVEVNGEAVVDRRDRLLRLLSDANGDTAEATRISNESARYNIGPISRNFNVPTTALFFFHPANLPRFTFKIRGRKKIEDIETVVLEFKETRRPSMVMTRQGKDVPCEGTVWVSPADGTIVRTLVTFKGFADDRALQEIRDKSGNTAPVRPHAPPPPQSPPPAQPPTAGAGAGNPGQNRPSNSSGGGGSTGASAAAAEESRVGSRLTPQQMFTGELHTRKVESMARFEVTYKRHGSFAMWLPAKMSEWYEGPIPRGAQQAPILGQAAAVADYADFKQFTTSAKIGTTK